MSVLIDGFNVHSKLKVYYNWSAQDKRDHLALLEELQPSAMLYLDWLDMAREVKRLLPDCRVIHRQFFEYDLGGDRKFTEGSIWQYDSFENKKTQDWLYDRIARDGEGGLIVNVLNEPSGYGTHLPKLVGWLLPLCERLQKNGIRFCGPNWGVGHPDENRLDELAPLLALFTQPGYQDMAYWGIHEYWAWDGINYGNGRVGRFEKLAQYLARAGRPVPDMIVTEFGIDDKGDGSNKRGWRDAGISEVDYASQGEEVRDRYAKWQCIKGFTWYLKGRTSSDWESHDTQGCTDFDQALVKRAKELRGIPHPPPLPIEQGGEQEPISPPVPASGDPRFKDDYRASPAEAGSNTVVREFPSAASKKLRVIEQTGLTVKHIPPVDLTVREIEYQTPDGVLWQVLRLPDGQVGYCHSTYIKLTVVADPTPPPLPPAPVYITYAEAEKLAEAVAARAVAQALAAFRAELFGKFQQIFSEEKA